MHLDGRLTSAMLDEPDAIDWGLSEIASVTAVPKRLPDDRVGYEVAVSWEGERSLRILAAGIAIERSDVG